MPGARVIRGANFAYPYSEREGYFYPRTVKQIIAISFIIVMALVALPFYLRRLEAMEYVERGEITNQTSQMRLLVDAAAPMLERKAMLDSIKAGLDARVTMQSNIEAIDYAADRLLLHLAELVPDGIILTYLEMRPSTRTEAGRPGLSGPEAELPEELQSAYILSIVGTARNAETLSRFHSSMDNSPLFFRPTQSFNIEGSGLSFRINCRLWGSGATLEGGGD